jgi:site-specific DNA recombinase
MSKLTDIRIELPYLKCASYIRFSSKKQSEGFSVEYQSTANKKLIININGELAGEYIDEAVSGFYTRIGARKGMSKLLTDIENGKVNGVVFYDESRLSRRIMDVYRDFTIPILAKNPNMKFFRSCDGTLWNPENSEAKRNLIDAFKESAKKQAYAKRGHSELLESNIRPGSRLPLGIQAILSDRIVPDDNIAIVLFIFELASWGYSEQKIADILTNMNFNLILPKTKRLKKKDPDTVQVGTIEAINKEWSHTTIHYILNNPIYIGKGVWNRRLSRNNSAPGPEDQQQSFGTFDPIIPIDLWNLVHAEFDKKRILVTSDYGQEIKKASVRMDTSFKVSGILQCSKCNTKMLTKNSLKSSAINKTHTRKGSPLCYYYCPTCRMRLDSNFIDENVIHQLKQQILMHLDEQSIMKKLDTWTKSLSKRIKELEIELEEEKYYFSEKSIEKYLTQSQLSDYYELSQCNIQLIQWKIEGFREALAKCKNFETSNAIVTLVQRIKNRNIETLNNIEQRFILFSTIESLKVKQSRNGEVIIDELELRGIPLPFITNLA